MDSSRAGIKRPRNSTASKGAGGDSTTKKKKSKKSKSQKKQKTGSDAIGSTSKAKSSLDETATADGQMMARMLSTFSSMEQSRFAAYKRSTLRADSVQEWVATCLQHRVMDPRSINCSKPPKLADLVTPGTHNEIGTIAAIAAKVYAQRLVAASLKIAGPKHKGPLQPQHVWKAFSARKKEGLDPGFYLQPNESMQLTSTASLLKEQEQRRLAALAAQEVYDKRFGAPEEKSSDGEEEKHMDTT